MKHTWKEWNELGYRIIKGEKSCERNEKGICVFDESQVIEHKELSPEEAELYGFENYY